MLSALSPLDGRYARSVGALQSHFSEQALIRARLEVEIRYFIALGAQREIRQLPKLKAAQEKALLQLVEKFSERDAREVKKIEQRTNHDVKAVEYFLRRKMERVPGLKKHAEFVHFGLTSEDVNNLAYGLMVHGALRTVIHPALKSLHSDLQRLAKRWTRVQMLSLTHGQPATPTTLGKEFQVFADRLQRQLLQSKSFKMQGKFGGAVGNYAAVKIAYPEVQWEAFGKKFIRSLGLAPLEHTTQINPHDDLAELSHLIHRIDTILLDFSRDAWLYISRGIFRQRVVKGEVGSSTMPHKVNPIDFENAEGNLGIANALFSHFAEKLPVSRLQRDLSDSTVQRNIGVAFGYHLLAVASLRKGIQKLELNRRRVQEELEEHPEVMAEAIQILLRKHGVPHAYERLKAFTRGRDITVEQLHTFIKSLPLPSAEKQRLLHSL
ncbi:MAG: adenylosuccinate lyase [Candidatus Peribacteraceae bacterium]|nr:adenylosuccinate lyase [Candidatus Peribacteraceae bacterium]